MVFLFDWLIVLCAAVLGGYACHYLFAHDPDRASWENDYVDYGPGGPRPVNESARKVRTEIRRDRTAARPTVGKVRPAPGKTATVHQLPVSTTRPAPHRPAGRKPGAAA